MPDRRTRRQLPDAGKDSWYGSRRRKGDIPRGPSRQSGTGTCPAGFRAGCGRCAKRFAEERASRSDGDRRSRKSRRACSRYGSGQPRARRPARSSGHQGCAGRARRGSSDEQGSRLREGRGRGGFFQGGRSSKARRRAGALCSRSGKGRFRPQRCGRRAERRTAHAATGPVRRCPRVPAQSRPEAEAGRGIAAGSGQDPTGGDGASGRRGKGCEGDSADGSCCGRAEARGWGEAGALRGARARKACRFRTGSVFEQAG